MVNYASGVWVQAGLDPDYQPTLELEPATLSENNDHGDSDRDHSDDSELSDGAFAILNGIMFPSRAAEQPPSPPLPLAFWSRGKFKVCGAFGSTSSPSFCDDCLTALIE